ncbi:hypothetical protein ACHAQH_005135 [Verticillium albo-atrum]
MGTHISDGLPGTAEYCKPRQRLLSTTQSSLQESSDSNNFVLRPCYKLPAMKRDLSSVGHGYHQWRSQSQRLLGGAKAAKQHGPSTPTIWSPSTPIVSVEAFENYTYDGPSGYEKISASYTSSPTPMSPRGWSATSDQSDWNSPTDQAHHHQSHPGQLNDKLRLCGSVSADELPGLRDVNIALSYPRYLSDLDSHPADFMSRPNSPSMLSETPPYSIMAASDVDPSNVFSPLGEDQSMEAPAFMSPEPPLPEGASPRAMDASKNGEPYARLIYRAFMSVPGHAMTLQEIYQWFRVNTDKAISPGKEGWKNSIRHNLSMNHVSHTTSGISNSSQRDSKANAAVNKAFVRREKPQDTEPGADGLPSSPRPAGEGRKSTEWVLEEWALRDGVQSTTRYRPKGNGSTKRGRNSPRSHNVTYHANPKHPHHSRPGRAMSGERGGFATSRGKRKGRQDVQSPATAGVLSQQMSMLNLRIDATSGQPLLYQYPQQQQLYEQSYPHQPSPHPDTVLATPLTPEGTPAGLGFGMSGPNMMPPVSSHPHTGACDLSQYSLADVAGVYPASRFFEDEDMGYGWGQDDHHPQSGSGSPAM